MILKSLKLKNFRKFEDSLIDFPDGVTGVIGLNGAGKSTIFEAIAWTLYGPVAARTPADQIKREGTSHSDPCRIELEFLFGDDKYRVVRDMTGKSLTASASATVNGKLAANGAEVVSKFIQKKLGMDFKSFYTSIFAKQKELNALSTMNPSERRPLILRMLGIGAMDDVITEIRSDLKDKRNLIGRYETDLVDEQGKNRVEKFQNEIQELEKKKEEITNLIKQIKKDILEIEKESSQSKKKCDAKKIEYEKILEKKDQQDERKILFDKKKRLEEELKNLKEKIKERQEKIRKQKTELKNFEKIDQELRNLEKRQNDNNENLENILKKFEQKKILIDRTNKDIKEIQQKKSEIEKIGPSAKCPTCERVLGKQYNKLLDNFGNEILKKNNEISSLQKDIGKVEEERERLSREKQALQKKNNYLQSQWRERERIDTTINDLTEEIKKEERDLENKNSELKKIGPVEFKEEIYVTIKKKVDESYKKYQTSLNELNEIRSKLEKQKLSQAGKEGEKNLVIQQIKNFQKKIEELEKLIKKMKEEKKIVQHLSILNEIMASFRTHLISQIRPTLSRYASELFNQLTDGKYSEIELDENYNLIVYDDGSGYNIERFSGGEEDLANLCIRLAISEVITERAGSVFNFIILDEIFGSQDNIRRQNIIKALNSFSSKFRQIFLITHIEDIKNYMGNTITVLEKENGISAIKIE